MVWREGSLSEESRRALMKLRSLGGDHRRAGARLRSRASACATRRSSRCAPPSSGNVIVRFSYLKPGDAAARVRTVRRSPWCSIRAAGTCTPTSRRSAATRTFLLRRIVSDVAMTGTAFTPPAGDHAGAGTARAWRRCGTRTSPRSTAQPDTDAAVRLGKRRGAVRTDAVTR